MQTIEKISDITPSDLAEYIRIPEPTQDDLNLLSMALKSAKDYICKYTGIPEEELDEYIDLINVVFVMCQDCYDTRAMYVDTSNINRVVETTLGLHQRNLL